MCMGTMLENMRAFKRLMEHTKNCVQIFKNSLHQINLSFNSTVPKNFLKYLCMNLGNSFSNLCLSFFVYRMEIINNLLNQNNSEYKKYRQRMHETAIQNAECYYLDLVGNYSQCVPLVKVYSLAPLDSFSAIHVITKLLLFCLSILSGWLNAQNSHLNQHKNETWRRKIERGS